MSIQTTCQNENCEAPITVYPVIASEYEGECEECGEVTTLNPLD